MARKRKPVDQSGGPDAPVAPVPATTPSGSGAASPDRGDGDLVAERTRKRAHEIYERRKAMGLPGDAEGDWLQAEAELGGQTEPRS